MVRKLAFLGAIICVITALFIFRSKTEEPAKKAISKEDKKEPDEKTTEIPFKSASKTVTQKEEEIKKEQDSKRTVIVSGTVIDTEGNPIVKKTVSYQIILESKSILDELVGLQSSHTGEETDPDIQLSKFITALATRNKNLNDEQMRRIAQAFIQERSVLPRKDWVKLEQLFSNGSFMQALNDLKKLNNSVTTDENGYFEFEVTYKANPNKDDKLIISLMHPQLIETNEPEQSYMTQTTPEISRTGPTERSRGVIKTLIKPIGIMPGGSLERQDYTAKSLTIRQENHSQKFVIDEAREIISGVTFVVNPICILTVNIEPSEDITRDAYIYILFEGYDPIFRYLRDNKNKEDINIPILANMPFTLSCFANGYLDYTEQYPPLTYGTNEVTVTLSKGSIPFSGVVTDDKGTPIEKAQINVSQEGLQWLFIYTDSTGKFSTHVASPNINRVTIHAPGYREIELTNVDATKFLTARLKSAPNSPSTVNNKRRNPGTRNK